MSRTFVVEPEAEAEINQAADWYESHNATARTNLLSALARAVDFILENPEQYQIAYGRTRRAIVHGFPYALFYVVTDSDVILLACVHTARNPSLWP